MVECEFIGKRESIQLGAINRSVEDELSEGNLEELSLFKMEMLANATSSFSEANKLGRGGFGPVYKVASHTDALFVLHIFLSR